MRNFMIALVVTMVLSVGCIGIIANGSSQDIEINSVPAGAEVNIDNVFVGITPYVANLSRSESHLVEIVFEGYDTETFQISKSADGGIIIADIFLTGGIGLLIDMGTGAMYKLSPDSISAELSENLSVRGDAVYITMNPSN